MKVTWFILDVQLGIENLPCELQRNFTLMRDLDNRTEGKRFTENIVTLIVFTILFVRINVLAPVHD